MDNLNYQKEVQVAPYCCTYTGSYQVIDSKCIIVNITKILECSPHCESTVDNTYKFNYNIIGDIIIFDISPYLIIKGEASDTIDDEIMDDEIFPKSDDQSIMSEIRHYRAFRIM